MWDTTLKWKSWQIWCNRPLSCFPHLLPSKTSLQSSLFEEFLQFVFVTVPVPGLCLWCFCISVPPLCRYREFLLIFAVLGVVYLVPVSTKKKALVIYLEGWLTILSLSLQGSWLVYFHFLLVEILCVSFWLQMKILVLLFLF